MTIIDTDTARILYDDASTLFKYKSIGAMKSHHYAMHRSKEGKIATIDPLLDGRSLSISLYPVIGAIHMHDMEGNELRMVKDNQYSLDHLSA
jgi:hypothetical protein